MRIAYLDAARLAGLVVPISLGVSAIIASPVLATGKTQEEFCQEYAFTATDYAGDAVKANCGFRGPRWSTNRDDHYQWCLSLDGNQKPANDEQKARYNALQDCAKFCKDYMHEAIKDIIKNDQLKCGFTGQRWSENEDDHFNWCHWKGGRPYANAETAARKAALEGCMRNHPNPAAPVQNQAVPTPAPKSSTGGAGSEPCDSAHIRYDNGTCGCPSGLTGPKCDEIVLH